MQVAAHVKSEAMQLALAFDPATVQPPSALAGEFEKQLTESKRFRFSTLELTKIVLSRQWTNMLRNKPFIFARLGRLYIVILCV
jgi:hypothetical protein